MKKILLLMTAIIAFSSCEDASRIETTGQILDELAFQTVADLQLGLNTVYSNLNFAPEYEFSSVFTDECAIGFANGGQGVNDNYAFILNSQSDSPDGILFVYLRAINRANRVIEASSLIDVEAGEEPEFNSILGQAYALRAFCHLQLTAYLSPNMLDGQALGTFLLDRIPGTDENVPRSTNSAVYGLINQDLNTAEGLLTGATEDVFYVGARFVTGLRARFALYSGNYADALTYSNQVISSSGALTTGSAYRTMYHNDTDPSECIFKLKRGIGGQQRIGAIWASVNTTITGSPFFEFGRSLFNELNTLQAPGTTDVTITAVGTGGTVTIPNHGLSVNDAVVCFGPSATSYTPGATFNGLVAGRTYFVRSIVDDNRVTLTAEYSTGTPLPAPLTTTNNLSANYAGKTNYGDVRFSTMVSPTSLINYNYTTAADPSLTDRLVMRKYPGATGKGNLVNDIKVMRLSEMFLIKAEAQAQTGDLAGVAATIKQLRDARTSRLQALPSYANLTAALTDILSERRKELAFEGHRYIDLKRLGVVTNVGILRDPIDCAINGACSLPASDYRMTLPIAISEIRINSAAIQNPGYID
jgi:starch-binding outer membrane protein, SusD/RagB family